MRRKKAGVASGAQDAADDNVPDEWDAEPDQTPAAAAPAAPAAAAAAAAPAAPAKSAEPGESIGEVEKKVKAMQKKIRQIGALRADAEAGKELNADQQGKLAGEEAAQAELAALEAKLADMHAALLNKVAGKP